MLLFTSHLGVAFEPGRLSRFHMVAVQSHWVSVWFGGQSKRNL